MNLSPDPIPQPSAAPRVRVTLMLARGERILLGGLPCADGSLEYALPSSELAGGESLRECARAIAEAAVDGKLVNLMFQRVALLAGADAVPELVLGMYGEIVPGGPDPLTGAPPEARSAPWRFFHRDSLPAPLESATALALLACREEWLAIDLDARSLPVGFGLPDTRNALREQEAPRRARWGGSWRAALCGASAAAWLIALLSGLQQRLSDGLWGWGANAQYTLACLALFAGYWCAQRQAADAAARSFARSMASAVVAAGVAWAMVLISNTLGGGDAQRALFWVGCSGALLMLVFWPKPEAKAGLWLAGWVAAAFVSASVTLPPLGDALYGHAGETAEVAPVLHVVDDD